MEESLSGGVGGIHGNVDGVENEGIGAVLTSRPPVVPCAPQRSRMPSRQQGNVRPRHGWIEHRRQRRRTKAILWADWQLPGFARMDRRLDQQNEFERDQTFSIAECRHRNILRLIEIFMDTVGRLLPTMDELC
jgi:hypothetical protein